jgi:hypothetical protein
MLVDTAERIYQESQILPENLRAEVLDFIGYLKTRYGIKTENVAIDKKVAELEAAFAPYCTDFQGFVFNREEANER